MARREGVTVQRLDEALGGGAGTVEGLFAGRLALELRHVLVMLETFGLSPARFFRLAFPEDADAQSEGELAAQLLDLLDRLGSPQREPPPRDEISSEELDRRIEDALQRLGVRAPSRKDREGG
jgi:hypothetical protein